MTTNQRRWMSPAEAADYLGISPRTLRNYISEGKLPAYRLGGKRTMRIDRADLDALLRPIPTTGGAHR